MIKIALVGNPNSGKTTLFNELTGSNQSVGNWPGVTVEKKSGKLKYNQFEAEIIDLPGIYSLSTVSLEEEIARKYILDNQIDLIINIVDASNLERNLFLTYQLLDSNIPLVIALNCMDLIAKKLDNLDFLALQEELKVPVIPITASKKHGISDLILYMSKSDFSIQTHHITYRDDIEKSVNDFEQILGQRFLAVRFFEDGMKAIKSMRLHQKTIADLEKSYQENKKKFSIDFDMVLPNYRYDRIKEVCDKVLFKSKIPVVSKTERIDRILTNRWLGLPLFGIIMFLVFFLAFGPIGTWLTSGFIKGINWLFTLIVQAANSLNMASWVSSLLTNGVFGGLAAVVGFLPQLMILFFALSILEDSGYMARAAFIMDRALSKFGLSGKAFIPMLIGFGCSVPAMASTRTLDRDEDRKITTMIIPFISCGAKAPIYGVFAGALFFNYSYLVVFSMYILGIVVAILSALLFKKTILKSDSANYIMELPEYRAPTAKNTLLHTWERSKGFLIKAGTVLLGAFIVIWFFSYFGFVDGGFRLLAKDEIEYSILGIIGKFFLPVFRPIGFTSWKSTVAIMTGFAAKESVVGTLGILYGITGDVIQNGALLFEPIRMAFSPVQAYAFMAFALLASPCIAAMSAMKRELHSWKWFSFSIIYELSVAYLVALLIFQFGSMDSGTILSVIFAIIVLAVVFFTFKSIIKKKGVVCGSCNNCSVSGSCHLPKKEDFVKIKNEIKKGDGFEN